MFGFGISFEVPYFQAPTDRGPGIGIGVAFALFALVAELSVNGPGRGLSYGRAFNIVPSITVWFGPGKTAVPPGKLSVEGGQAWTLEVAKPTQHNVANAVAASKRFIVTFLSVWVLKNGR